MHTPETVRRFVELRGVQRWSFTQIAAELKVSNPTRMPDEGGGKEKVNKW